MNATHADCGKILNPIWRKLCKRFIFEKYQGNGFSLPSLYYFFKATLNYQIWKVFSPQSLRVSLFKLCLIWVRVYYFFLLMKNMQLLKWYGGHEVWNVSCRSLLLKALADKGKMLRKYTTTGLGGLLNNKCWSQFSCWNIPRVADEFHLVLFFFFFFERRESLLIHV